MRPWVNGYRTAEISLQVTDGPEDNTEAGFPEANQVERNREGRQQSGAGVEEDLMMMDNSWLS